MSTGWLHSDGSWYYLSGSGAMVTGWLRSGGDWYYLSSSGAMTTGWFQDGSSWYFSSASGVMHTGWLNSGSNWYYMDATGAMVTGTVPSWRASMFSSSGRWIGYGLVILPKTHCEHTDCALPGRTWKWPGSAYMWHFPWCGDCSKGWVV